MKFWNFEKFLDSKQSSRKCCLTQRAPIAANQMYLIKRRRNIDSDCRLPFPPLEERKMMYKVPFQALCGGTELRRAIPANHPIPASLFPVWTSYSTGRQTLHGVSRLLMGMSYHTKLWLQLHAVTDGAWPQGCGHHKPACLQAHCGYICWFICYVCRLKYILKRKLI